MNIFESASRKKLRFPSDRGGDFTTEQLWDLGLTQLDTIARKVNARLKSVTDESFINTRPDPRKPDLELQLEILKHVIASHVKAAEKKKAVAAANEKRRRILDALADKEQKEIGEKSKDDLIKELNEIDETIAGRAN